MRIIAIALILLGVLATAHEPENLPLRARQNPATLLQNNAELMQAANSDFDHFSMLKQKLETKHQQLFQQLRDMQRGLMSPPGASPMCEICVGVTDKFFESLDHFDNSTTWHLVEWVLEVACAELTKTPEEGKICMDIVDALIHGISSADREAMLEVHFNLSMITCSDLLPICTVSCCKTNNAPEQIHIGFPMGGDVVSQGLMQATWSTYEKASAPSVMWWPIGNVSAAQTVEAKTTTYTVSGWRGWLYGGVMSGLEPGVTYSYKVGDSTKSTDDVNYWSQVWNFTMMPANVGTKERPLRLLSYADMGTGGTHDETIESTLAYVKAGKVDMIVHGGDISYADGDMYRWDRYMEEMQPIAASVPYMCIPGNHELLYNFTAYRVRFFMQPKSLEFGAPEDAMFYTFSVGPQLRFLMLDSESPINTPFIGGVQQNFIKNVLESASSRRQFVWSTFHRPLYCTSRGGESCFLEQDYLQSQVEDLFYKHNVGIVHTGHIHNYERCYPAYKGKLVSTSYLNTTAPVSFVNGAPGCEEGLTEFQPWNGDRPTYSAKRISHTSFQYSLVSYEQEGSSLKYTMDIQQISSKNQTVIDQVSLTKYL